MKVLSTKVDDQTAGLVEQKAREQNITVSEYLRQEITPLIEGTKGLSLEQCLAKLDAILTRIKFCVGPLQELAFGLHTLEAQLILRPEEKEKEPDAQNKTELETTTGPN